LLKNKPENFSRDLKLFRGFMIFLALAACWMSYDYFISTECSVISGRGGSMLTDFCLFFGPKITAVALLFLGGYLIYGGFREKTKQRLRKLYS